jgi:DNA-binding NarL/FixJ family response regulator
MAEDHLTLREGLKLLLEMEGDIHVVAETESGHDTIQVALAEKPDVLLMDVALVGLDGIEATRQLHAQMPTLAIVMLSAHPELHLVRAAIEAGAAGYLLKRASGRELREAVRATADGTPYFSEEILRAVRERTLPQRVHNGPNTSGSPNKKNDPVLAEDPAASLTDREYEILQMIASGHSNREIAEILKLSIKTVETHRMHVMGKLDIHDVASLTRYAIRKGLINC